MRKDLAKAVELVRQGCSFGQAAKKVGGITRNAVAGACHRAGVKTGRPQGDGSVTAAAIALYLDGTPLPEINKRMGWKPTTSCVHKFLQKAGIEPNRYRRQTRAVE